MQTNYRVIAEENIKRFGTAIDEYGPQLLADRYSDRTHFIYELLQNAEDAIGWRLQLGQDIQRSVAFRLTREALVFRHAGLPFAEEHVRGICNIGKGTKRHDLTAIGKHGLGFKSVYAYTHHPEIHSGDEHFVIESFVRPRAIPAKTTSDHETLFIFPFDHPDIPSDAAYTEILGRFHQLGLKTLLFLRHITSVQWEAESGDHGQYLRESRPLRDGIEHVSLLGQSSRDLEPLEETWLVLRKAVQHKEEPAGFVEIAFQVTPTEGGGSGADRITRVPESPLVVFFPTEKETHFGFLIQGPYRTTPSRDNVPKDDRWNQHLVRSTAELVVESLEKLRSAGLLSASALDALVVEPEKYDSSSQASMFYPIAKAVIDAIKTSPLIPRFKSGHISANDARLARAAGVRNLVSGEQLTQLCGSPMAVRWVSGDVTRERMARLHEFLAETLEVEELDAESLVRRVNEGFLKAQSDDWIQRFYEFLLEQPAVRRQPWFAAKPIVRLSNNTHVLAMDADGAPGAYLPSSRRTGFPTVKKGVCASEGAIKLLKELGLKEPDPVDDVTRNVLPRYTAQADKYPPEYDDDVERILEAYQTDSQKRRADLIDKLREGWWIPCKNAESNEIILGKAEHNTYLPTQKLSKLLSGNSDVWFADRSRPVLQGKLCQAVLEACGVSEYLQTNELSKCDLPESELSRIRRQAGLQRSSYGRITDYTIQGLSVALDSISAADANWQDLSHQLWDCIHDSIRHFREAFLFGEYSWSYSHEARTERIPAQFVRMLRKARWLPGKNGAPCRPSELCLADLPEAFQRDANPTFVGLLEFKPDEIRQLAEKTGIDTAILDFIRDQGLTIEELRSRLGIGSASDDAESHDPDEGESEASSEGEEGSHESDQGEAEVTSDGEANDDGESSSDLDESSESEETDSDNGEHQGTGSSRDGTRPGRRPGGSDSTGSPGGSPGTGTRKPHGSGGAGSGNEDKESRGHTAADREGIISRMLRQLEQVTSTGVSPSEADAYGDLQSSRTFQSDARFREAVMEYERKRNRIPQLKDESEEGHDIDSFIREKGSIGRKLLRRIEVKGKGVPWTDDEIVEMSDRQYRDASQCELEAGVTRAPGFDYWLYVVEDDGSGKLNVLPIRNPAKRAAHYEFRAGTWRHLAEVEEETTPG